MTSLHCGSPQDHDLAGPDLGVAEAPSEVLVRTRRTVVADGEGIGGILGDLDAPTFDDTCQALTALLDTRAFVRIAFGPEEAWRAEVSQKIVVAPVSAAEVACL